MVVLHSTDAGHRLSVRPRTEADVEPGDVEHELYEEADARAHARHAPDALRRATRARSDRLRRVHTDDRRSRAPQAREDDRGQRALDSPRRVAHACYDSRASRRSRPEAKRSRPISRRTSRFWRNVFAFGVGSRFEATQSVGSRVLPQLAMEGRIVRGRPRGTWVNGQYRWMPMETWLDGADTESWNAEKRRRSFCGAGSRPSGLRPRPIFAGGRAGRPARRERRSQRCRTRSSISKAQPDSCSPRTSSPPSERIRQPLSSPRSTRRRWAGRSETGTWALTRAPVRLERKCGADRVVGRRVVGGWSQRRDGEIVFRLLEDVGRDAVAAVEAEVARVTDWLGDSPLLPWFPAAVSARAASVGARHASP